MRLLQSFVFLPLLFCWLNAAADVPVEQQAEVEHLINYLKESGCPMVRNNKSYNGKDGASHVRRKYNHFRDWISSTEEFIEYAASKSTKSGEYYEVQCPGEESMRSQDWLLMELQAYRNA